VTLPADEALPGLGDLFDSAWVWHAFCAQFGTPEEIPQQIRPRHLHYQPGARAVVSYVAERQWDRWVAEDEFAIELVAGKPPRLFRYPDDPYLPGLSPAASAVDAHQLILKHLSIHPHRLYVEAVRYRPGARAVLRHRAIWRRAASLSFFVRVMPPARVSRLLAAAELAAHSSFVLPRLAGWWTEGGVVWLASIPGETVRTLIREGKPPDPNLILDCLSQLWSTPVPPDAGHPLDLAAGIRWTQRLLSNVLQDEGARQALQRVTDALGPFAEEWRPSALAHNDFYDAQVLLMPTGRLALVDFEETGPGDPLLDVGNLLAHLRWSARFGAPEACEAYRRHLRSAALDRFGWEERALVLREASALFRVCSNPIRHLQHNWPQTIKSGLALVAEVLDGAP
jgi:hypothetical protein